MRVVGALVFTACAWGCLLARAPGHFRHPSQVDPSVLVRAFSSALSTSSLPLTNSDVFVNITGGTPEPLVAAIACGYRTIFHVAGSGEEELMFNLPTEEEQRLNNINYFEYKSPEPELPGMGVLAAEAVRQITQYLKNECTNTQGAIRVPLTQPVNIPPLQTYTYMPVLNQIVKRTIREGKDAQDEKEAGDVPATAGSKTPKKSVTNKTETPAPPTPKGVPTSKGASQADEDDEEEEDEEDDEEKVDNELQALEEMQQTGKKRKKPSSKSAAKKLKAKAG